VNVVAIVAALPLLAPGVYLLFVAETAVVGIPLLVGGVLVSQLVSYTPRGILKTSLYYYTTEGERPGGFDDVFAQLAETDRARHLWGRRPAGSTDTDGRDSSPPRYPEPSVVCIFAPHR
jgi:hypothetical protein